MPKKTDPLTIEEIKQASDIFFPLFSEVHSRMPKEATIEDALKVMEGIAKLAHKRRADKAAKEQELKFGFNKDEESEIAEEIVGG